MKRPITHSTRAAAYQEILPLAGNRQERAFKTLRERPGGLTAPLPISTISLNSPKWFSGFCPLLSQDCFAFCNPTSKFR